MPGSMQRDLCSRLRRHRFEIVVHGLCTLDVGERILKRLDDVMPHDDGAGDVAYGYNSHIRRGVKFRTECEN